MQDWLYRVQERLQEPRFKPLLGLFGFVFGCLLVVDPGPTATVSAFVVLVAFGIFLLVLGAKAR